MDQSEKFTTFEGYSFLSVILLFTTFSGALSRLSRYVAGAAWVTMVFGSILSFGYFFLYYQLARLYPGKSLLDILRQVLGRAGSKIVSATLFVYLLVFCVENLAESTNMMMNNTYAHFRPVVVSIAFLAIAGVVNLYPVKGLVRTSSICLPLFLASILFILLMNLKKYDPTYLFPLLGHGVRPIVEHGIFHMTSFDAFLLSLLFLDSFPTVRSYRKAGLWATLTANLTFVFTALCFGMSGPYQANQRSMSGLFDLARDIYINRFFQRFESVFIMFTSLGKILVLCIGLAALCRVFNDLFAIPPRHQRKPIFSILLLILGGGQLLFNFTSFWILLAEFTQKSNLIYALCLLAIIFCAGWIKKGFRPKPRPAALLLAVCLGCLSLSGCAQTGEADEEIFAVIMGYDKSDSETMRITMKIMPEDKKSAGGSGGGNFADEEGAKPHNVFSVDAPCNIPAADLINTVIPKHLSLLHVKMLVISEELAREDVDMLITSITRYDEVKPTIAVIICDGSAEEFITARTSELIPFLPLETEMILKRDKDNASYLVRTMEDVYKAYSSSTGDALAMYGGLTMDARAAKEQKKKDKQGASSSGETGEGEMNNPPSQEGQGDPEAFAGGNVPSVFYDDPSVGYLNGYLPGQVPITTAVETQIVGMAVFRENRMVGTLNSHETQMFMIADGSFAGSVLPVRDPYKPDFYVMYYATSRKPTKVRTSIDEEGKARIELTAYLQAKPTVVHNSDKDYQDPVEREILRQYTIDYLERELRAMVEKIQGEYDADSLRLGRYMAANFLTTQEWDAYNWREQYGEAEISISLDLKL